MYFTLYSHSQSTAPLALTAHLAPQRAEHIYTHCGRVRNNTEHTTFPLQSALLQLATEVGQGLHLLHPHCPTPSPLPWRLSTLNLQYACAAQQSAYRGAMELEIILNIIPNII